VFEKRAWLIPDGDPVPGSPFPTRAEHEKWCAKQVDNLGSTIARAYHGEKWYVPTGTEHDHAIPPTCVLEDLWTHGSTADETFFAMYTKAVQNADKKINPPSQPDSISTTVPSGGFDREFAHSHHVGFCSCFYVHCFDCLKSLFDPISPTAHISLNFCRS